ncbi:MAG TPA: NADP-dependent oxidoreductase, partial [Caulobacteraceae bacterium]|nr:NADP-dependent oxidoreductase [Caulobacteraceae bacterium]
MSTPSREIHLVKRPEGPPTPGDFAMVETEVPDPADGEVLVRNLYMSVDPAMRPRMSVGQALNEAMGGGAIGRVEKSRNPAFKEGELVTNRHGFREVFTSGERGLRVL